jgi:hypothetical protein
VAARGTALFAEPHEAEIIWAGKTYEVANVLLPFQSIEQIDCFFCPINAPPQTVLQYRRRAGKDTLHYH